MENQITKTGYIVGLALAGLSAIFIFIGFFIAALPMAIVSIILLVISAIAVGYNASQVNTLKNEYVHKSGSELTIGAAIASIIIFVICAIFLIISLFVAALTMFILTIILIILGLILTGTSLSDLSSLKKSDRSAKARGTSNDIKDDQISFNYCPNCGKKLSKNTKFCPSCGTKVK